MCQRWVRQEHGTVTYRNLERFQAKWIPVRVKKTRQNKKIEPRSDSIGTEKALVTTEAILPIEGISYAPAFALLGWTDGCRDRRRVRPDEAAVQGRARRQRDAVFHRARRPDERQCRRGAEGDKA